MASNLEQLLAHHEISLRDGGVKPGAVPEVRRLLADLRVALEANPSLAHLLDAAVASAGDARAGREDDEATAFFAELDDASS